MHGPLDAISSLPFENYLQRLQKLVRNRNVPLLDSVNSLHEKRHLQTYKISRAHVFSGKTHGGYLPAGCDQSVAYTEYNKVNVSEFSFATAVRDSCIMLNSSHFSIGMIYNILDMDGDTMFVCRSYRSVKSVHFIDHGNKYS